MKGIEVYPVGGVDSMTLRYGQTQRCSLDRVRPRRDTGQVLPSSVPSLWQVHDGYSPTNADTRAALHSVPSCPERGVCDTGYANRRMGDGVPGACR